MKSRWAHYQIFQANFSTKGTFLRNASWRGCYGGLRSPLLYVIRHKLASSAASTGVWRVMAERLRALDSSSGVWSAECGFESRSWHLLHKIGEVVLSALPARLRTDDTQAYIRMDCKRGNPVSAQGVGGNGLWEKHNCSPHLEVALKGRYIKNQASLG